MIYHSTTLNWSNTFMNYVISKTTFGSRLPFVLWWPSENKPYYSRRVIFQRSRLSSQNVALGWPQALCTCRYCPVLVDINLYPQQYCINNLMRKIILSGYGVCHAQPQGFYNPIHVLVCSPPQDKRALSLGWATPNAGATWFEINPHCIARRIGAVKVVGSSPVWEAAYLHSSYTHMNPA